MPSIERGTSKKRRRAGALDATIFQRRFKSRGDCDKGLSRKDDIIYDILLIIYHILFTPLKIAYALSFTRHDY